MAWVRKDENAALHPKFFRAGVAAYGWHDAGLGYCNRYLTDGFLPRKDLLLIFPGTPVEMVTEIVETLVREGLLETHEHGWTMHDYLEYQPSRREVLSQRKVRRSASRQGGINSGKKRQALASTKRYHEVQAGTSTENNGGLKHPANPRPDPARPDPARPDPVLSEGATSPATAENAVATPPPAKAKHPVSEPALRDLVKVWAASFKEHRGVEPHIEWPRACQTIKPLVTQYGAKVVQALIEQLFRSQDKFIHKTDYGLGVLRAQVNRLLVELQGGGGPPTTRTNMTGLVRFAQKEARV